VDKKCGRSTGFARDLPLHEYINVVLTSSRGARLNFTSQERNLLGTYVRVQVTGAGPNSLAGEQVT